MRKLSSVAFVFLVVCILTGISLLSAALPGTVRTEGGLVSGIPGSTPEITVFKGIPYAAAPVGDLRWRPPAPAAKWDGVRKADKFGPVCMQPSGSSEFASRSEDCLYLNIWSPAKSPADALPVMVWIHGGGFTTGASSMSIYDGEKLARKGVVLVSFNYRLGPIGYLAHPDLTKESDKKASGNYGLLDQIAAIQWVHRNIAAFGGDPKKVTIFGQSAGSSSVSLVVASPLAKGLFRAAIGESGAAFRGGLSTMKLPDAEQVGLRFAKEQGAGTIAELRAIPAEKLLVSQPSSSGGMRFAPIVDGWVIPEDPYSIYSKGNQSRVPVIVGTCDDEGQKLFRNPVPAAELIKQARTKFGDMADAYLRIYPAGSEEEAKVSQQKSYTDEQMALSMRSWARFAVQSGQNAHVYWLSFGFPPSGPGPGMVLGSPHGGDLMYVFNTIRFKPTPPDETDRKLANLMSSYWSNFGKTLDPNGTGLPPWPIFDPAKPNMVMELGKIVEFHANPHSAGIQFFENYYAKQRGR